MPKSNILKPKKLILPTFLLLGLAYFSVMSNLEINYLLKIVTTMIPLQLGAFIYVFYLHKNRS